jgi:hypothetical protein
MSRAFATNAPNLTSSDRSVILKQQTIYQNIRSNIKNQVCQKSGNKPGSVNYCLTLASDKNKNVTSAKIRSTINYETLYNVTKGKAYCQPCNILLNEFTGANGQSSNTLYQNPDEVTIASVASNYDSTWGPLEPWPKGSGLCCANNPAAIPQRIYKEEPVGVTPIGSSLNGILPDHECDRSSMPNDCGYTPIASKVIIDPSHNTFRTNCKSAFMNSDKPGPWINRITIANPAVMSQYAYNSYSKYLTGFSLPRSLNVDIYPKNTLIVNNCRRFPQYNGVYLLEPNVTLVQPISLTYSQWRQIGSKRTIIPCIGLEEATFMGTGPPALPTLFNYVLSDADLGSAAFPAKEPFAPHPHFLWQWWDAYDILELATVKNLQLYVTNVIRLDATGLIPYKICTPHSNCLNSKNKPDVVTAWKTDGISDLLVNPPTQTTFSAQYVDKKLHLNPSSPSPLSGDYPILAEDIITITLAGN